MRYVQLNKTCSLYVLFSAERVKRMSKKENDALQCRTLKSKIVALVMCFVLGTCGCMFLSACSTDSGSGSDSAATSESSESSEAAVQDDAQKSSSNSGNVNKKFKKAVDSYVEFIDEYVALMKKYDKVKTPDASLLADYADFVKKYTKLSKKFEKWDTDSSLNADEVAYYAEAQAKITKKLAEIGQ